MLMQDSGYDSYQQVNLDAQAAAANPHQLILMLIDGLLKELIVIKGHIENKRLAEKGQSINKCLNILVGLDSALDRENGGELANNLHQLYEFAQVELFNASIKNNIEHLSNVENVMNNLRDGWEGFGKQA